MSVLYNVTVDQPELQNVPRVPAALGLLSGSRLLVTGYRT